jgi:hypothetical protein
MTKNEEVRVNAMYAEAMNTIMAAHNRSGALAAMLASANAERDALQAEVAALKAKLPPEPKADNVVPITEPAA